MKTFRIFLLGVFFLFFFSVASRAADWQFFSESPRGNYFYDASGMKTISKNVIRVLVKLDITPEECERWHARFGEKYRDFSHEEELKEINCSTKKARVISVTEYDENGEVIDRVHFGDTSGWDRIAPGTVNHALSKVVCKRQRAGKRK